ncbi:MAG: ribosome biogenesis GTPase Der [bacterium]|nr:ribosome biogenesis GTPase Der [bacterium]
MRETGTQELQVVALIGRANVGKSTLFNRLLRTRRALVEDRPGITRDRIAAAARIEGRDVLLVDTGGLDPEAEQGIPAAVRAQVEQVLEDAAVILFVVDVRDGLLPLDREIADLLRRAGRQVIVVANKSESPKQDDEASEFHALGFDAVIPTSAEHRRGMVDLEITIAERLPEREEPVERDLGVPRFAIIGRPNVGKSSLLNRLLGEERNIVADEPGTTRDSTDQEIQVGDRRLILIDTAGIRRQAKRSRSVERGSALMSVRSLERGDLALLVIDAGEGITDQDLKLARLCLDRGRPVVLLLNKWDRVAETRRAREIERQIDRRLGFVPDPVILRVSAKTGSGVSKILPQALDLMTELEITVPTAELNKALEEAVDSYAPPMRGRRRPHFFYATQTSSHPMTILVFMNDPQLLADNYRKYLASFFRRKFGVRSAPLRLRLRARARRGEESGSAPESRRPKR